MLKWILRLFLTGFLILGIGALGYLYVMSEEISSPDTPVIEGPLRVDENFNSNHKEEIKHLLAQKKVSLEHQSRLLESKKELLNKRKQEIEDYIMNETEKIRGKYQSRIDVYQTGLEKEYQKYVELKEQEYIEQMLAKQELYNNKLKDLVDNIEQTTVQQLEEYKQGLIKEFYTEKINYDLKLKFLDLKNEEKEEYEDKLAELENKQLLSIEDKEGSVNKGLENKIEEYKKKYNKELNKYEVDLKNKIEGELSKKRNTVDNTLEEYLVQQQALMGEEIDQRTKEIRETSKKELSSLESLIKEISQEYYSIQSEVSILEKEVIY